jgi:hypothetical protein
MVLEQTLFQTLTGHRDYKANGYMCEIYMETTDGAICYAGVTCNDGKFGSHAYEVCA